MAEYIEREEKCGCYHTQKEQRYTYHPITGQPIGHDTEVGVCWGTKEKDICSCAGDATKCDFYPEVRERARKEIKNNKDDVVEVETYNDLREAFVDFVCSGVHNPAPYCKNRRSTCVDKRGWCTYNDWCNGFNPDGRKG